MFNGSIKVPFVVIIIFVGLQRLQNSLSSLGFIDLISPFEKSPYITIAFIPLFLFFFQNSTENRNIRSRDLIHMILPIIFIVLNVIKIIPEFVSKIIFTTTTLFYWLLILMTLINYHKKTLMIYSFNKVNFRWLILMFSNITLITFFLNYTTLYWTFNQADLSLTNFYRGSSILWVITLLYLILNPIIIFGKDFLLHQLTMKTVLFDPWALKKLKKISPKDLIVLKKLKGLIPDIIYSLKEIEMDKDFFAIEEINLKALSKKLKIPISNLKFIFKYHCKISTHEYLNLLKISFSIQLIKQGFLNEKTIDSLSNECHFESRITFYKNFKKFTGKNPSEFSKI